MYTILRISDGDHKFPFLYKEGKIYWPDFGPMAFGEFPRFKIQFNIWVGGMGTEPQTYIINGLDTLACVPFRYEGITYNQYSQLPSWPKTPYYIDFHAIDETGQENPDYVSAQGITDLQNNYIFINIVNPKITFQPNNLLIKIQAETNNQSIKEYIMNCYGGDDVQTTWEMALIDDSNIYWISQSPINMDDNSATFQLNWSFKKSFEYIEGLKFMAICKNVVITGDNVMHVDIKSNIFPLTQDLYEFMLAVQNGYAIEQLDKIDTTLYTMKIEKPRIMDKTIQNVMEITSHSDSKANIIQPVFFRAREMAHIIVHPEITENISINLDPYKSQVDRFLIKIEGVTFQEIGRIEGGIIFKIQGNLLPGATKSGTYYILNQDSELVTTGKYTYES